MPYQPLDNYILEPGGQFSNYSPPNRHHPDGSYEIHLIKAQDPDFIPGDLELWPLYHQAISKALKNFPPAKQAALEAYEKLQQQLRGRQNRDLPPAGNLW